MAPTSCSRNEFNPTDDELIQLFLYNKINGNPLPKDVTILEYDLFGIKNPWEIWEDFAGSHSYHGTDLYFFTTPKKKFSTWSRSVRTIECGSWEGEDSGKIVVANGTKQCVGVKRRLRFEKSGTDNDGAWILHEYSIDSSLLNNSSANNYVLCRLRKNIRHDDYNKKNLNRTRQEEIKVTQQRKRVVLGLRAPTAYVDRNVCSGEDIHQEPRKQVECGDKRTKEVMISARTELVYKEDEDDDLTMIWPELFSLQLRKANGGLVQEKEIQMLPNTFYYELLLERLPPFYI
ncbi:NAC domain-containing protein 83-like [Gastrolobium bilobum]|uniref:NAC domain-containing protein 83-like n=1 Tax=Gastrolobium bilobum TaxID=150636 RepID=UPI002AB03814|nr:NAC domain-containing protein 83-like [Gastrolobium bilobum]